MTTEEEGTTHSSPPAPAPPTTNDNDGGGAQEEAGAATAVKNDDGSEGECSGEGDRMARGFASFLLGDLVPYFFAPVSLFNSSSSLSSGGSSDINDYLDRIDDLLVGDEGTAAEQEEAAAERRSLDDSRRCQSSMAYASTSIATEKVGATPSIETTTSSRSSSSRDDDHDCEDSDSPPLPFVNVRHPDFDSSGDGDDVHSDLDDSSSSYDEDDDDGASASASPALVVRLSELLNAAYGPCGTTSEQTDRVLSLLDAYRGRRERDGLLNLLEIRACSVRMMGATATTGGTPGGVESTGADPTFVRRVSELIRYVYGPAKATTRGGGGATPNGEDEESCEAETTASGEFGATTGAEVDRLAAVLRCYAGRERVLLRRLEARALRKAGAAARVQREGAAGTDGGRGRNEEPAQDGAGAREAAPSSVRRRSLVEFFRDKRWRSAARASTASTPSGSPVRPPTMTPAATSNVAPDDLRDVCCSQSAATEPASNVSPRSIATEATTVVAGPWTEDWSVPPAPVTTEPNHPPGGVTNNDQEQEAVPQAVGERSPSKVKRFDEMDAVGADDLPMARWTGGRPSSSSSPSPPSPSSSTDTSASSTVGSGGSASSENDGDDGVGAGALDVERRRKMKVKGKKSKRMSAAAAASGSVLKLLRGRRGKSITGR